MLEIVFMATLVDGIHFNLRNEHKNWRVSVFENAFQINKKYFD